MRASVAFLVSATESDTFKSDAENELRFDRVVELNEAAKQLLARSFRVNLLALDAMVQSKRGNTSVRGFDEVSSQMLRWSRELHALLTRLGEASASVVGLTSQATKDQHILKILARAVEQSGSAHARAVHFELLEGRSVALLLLRQDWRKVNDLLGDLDQLAMMACVLSRSAMIEACSAGPELRRQLSDVSQEFNAHAQSVVDILSVLLKTMRKGKVQ